MTCYSLKKIFEKKFSYKNLENAISVMGCIFGVYASNNHRTIIRLPLNKKYHKIKINFA